MDGINKANNTNQPFHNENQSKKPSVKKEIPKVVNSVRDN